MTKKIKVTYIGSPPPQTDTVLGSERTLLGDSLFQAFRDDREFRIKIVNPSDCTRQTMPRIFDRADMIHIDNARLCLSCWNWGLPAPDVVGPYAYPVDSTPPATRDDMRIRLLFRNWFYSSTVVRMADYPAEASREITQVVPGVDMNMLKQYSGIRSRWIMVSRGTNPLKEHPGIETELEKTAERHGKEILNVDNLPVESFRRHLRKTHLYICLSSFETMHRQAFEAMACNVPVIWPTDIHGGRWSDIGIRVKPHAANFVRIVDNNRWDGHILPKKEVEENFTLEHMRRSYFAAYHQASGLCD